MIALGNTTLNKLYLGSTEIKKAYLGDALVYQISDAPSDNVYTEGDAADPVGETNSVSLNWQVSQAGGPWLTSTNVNPGHGQFALRFESELGGFENIIIWLPTRSGVVTNVSFKVRQGVSSAPWGYRIRNASDTANLVTSPNITGADDWTDYNFTFTPDGSQAGLRFYVSLNDPNNNPGDTIFIDRIMMQTDPLPTATAPVIDITTPAATATPPTITVTEGVLEYYVPYISDYAVDAEAYLPTYNSGDATHRIITPANKNDLNNASYQHFFVEPGDYGSQITLTQSGTSGARRTIQLYVADNDHPATKPINTTNLAKIRFNIQADYWVIDRMAWWTDTNTYKMNEFNGGTNCIINRCITYNTAGGSWYLYDGSHDNIIQNCMFWNDDFSIQYDNAAIGISDRNNSNQTITGTIICQNDMYNKNDGIQLVKSKSNTGVYYNNTVVDCNRIWIDETLYCTDSGVHDPNGDYAMAENAVDIKAGSSSALEPVLFSNNYFSGFKPAPPTGAGGGIDDSTGAAFVYHYTADHVHVKNNFFNFSRMGVNIDDASVTTAALLPIIQDNIFKDVYGIPIRIDGSTVPISTNPILDDNYIVDCSDTGIGHLVRMRDSSDGEFTDNRLFNNTTSGGSSTTGSTGILTIADNEYYNSSPIGALADASDTVHGSDPTTGYDDLKVNLFSFTGSTTTLTFSSIIEIGRGFIPQAVGGGGTPSADLYDESNRPMPSSAINLGTAGINSPSGSILFDFETTDLTGSNFMGFGITKDSLNYIHVTLGSNITALQERRRVGGGTAGSFGQVTGYDFTSRTKMMITWSGTQQDIYVNGSFQFTNTGLDTIPVDTFTKIIFQNTGETGNDFTGTMHRVALWSTELTQEQAEDVTTI